MEQNLSIIKEFEANLKVFLLEIYGAYLPNDRIAILNSINYSAKINNTNLDIDQMKEFVTRSMLDDLIGVTCNKSFVINDNSINLQYGRELEETLINYYTKRLSEKFHFNIKEIPDLDLETMKLLNDKLGSSLDQKVFNENAIKLLDASELKDLAKKYDEDAIRKYFEKNASLASDDQTKQEENEKMKELTERENSVQIVWLHDKKYIKYIDEFGEVHLTEINNARKVEEFYTKKLASLKPDEKLNPEEFFRELSTLATETTLTPTKDVKTEDLNYEKINMLEFISSNEKIKKMANEEEITHNNEQNIHVVSETKDIVVTEDRLDHVDAKIIKDGNSDLSEENMQEEIDASNRLITREEFEELNYRLSREEKLTKEELESLRRYYIYHANENNLEEEKGPVLKPKSDGFAAKSAVIYIILFSLFLITIIKFLLVK